MKPSNFLKFRDRSLHLEQIAREVKLSQEQLPVVHVKDGQRFCCAVSGEKPAHIAASVLMSVFIMLDDMLAQ